MAIADRDELNIIFVSKMEISTAEKVMRAQMMTEFEKTIIPIFEKQKEISESKLELAKKLFMIALLNSSLKSAYSRAASRYFLQYLRLIKPDYKEISKFPKKWLQMRSRQYADDIIRTSLVHFRNGTPEQAFFDNRTVKISRTEMNAICECATLESYIQNGYEGKQWKSLLDGRERKTHHQADGQIRPLMSPFDVGNSQLMFPCDSSLGAEASEIVCCRCHMVPVKKYAAVR